LQIADAKVSFCNTVSNSGKISTIFLQRERLQEAWLVKPPTEYIEKAQFGTANFHEKFKAS